MKKQLYLPMVAAAIALLGTFAQAQLTKDVHLVLAGDSNWHRRISVYDDPAYLQLIQRIRNADASFTNLETLIHPLTQSANPWAGGGYAYSSPWLVDEIKWAGFKLLSALCCQQSRIRLRPRRPAQFASGPGCGTDCLRRRR
jgi:hypothetical protein